MNPVIASLISPTAKNNVSFQDATNKYIPLKQKLRPGTTNIYAVPFGVASAAGSGPNGWFTPTDLEGLDPTGNWMSTPLNWAEGYSVPNSNETDSANIALSLALLTDATQSPQTRVINYFEQNNFTPKGAALTEAQTAALNIPTVETALAKELSM